MDKVCPIPVRTTHHTFLRDPRLLRPTQVMLGDRLACTRDELHGRSRPPVGRANHFHLLLLDQRRVACRQPLPACVEGVAREPRVTLRPAEPPPPCIPLAVRHHLRGHAAESPNRRGHADAPSLARHGCAGGGRRDRVEAEGVSQRRLTAEGLHLVRPHVVENVHGVGVVLVSGVATVLRPGGPRTMSSRWCQKYPSASP